MTETSPQESVPAEHDQELSQIVREEEQCLARVLRHVAERARRQPQKSAEEYEREMLLMRDEMATARLEDVPPLLEQMERLQALAKHKRELTENRIDTKSPYFGHLVLEENGRRRDVLIGRSTYLDTQAGIRIVDWRDAPVSRLYYRYQEGDDYEEVFGEREVSGEVVSRRNVTISDGVLRRIGSPQGAFVRGSTGSWQRLAAERAHLAGGQGSAMRPERHHRPGRLGTGSATEEDKLLREITPLIDRRQFELLTRPDSGAVVIQGGAGSGKTTIGLHRMAYLNYNAPQRFRPERMLVVVFNGALARYMSEVLPALGVQGVAIRTYEDWAARLRQQHLPTLPRGYSRETPGVVTRLKKHPVMLKAIDELVARMEARFEGEAAALLEEAGAPSAARELGAALRQAGQKGLVFRLHAARRWLDQAQALSPMSPARLRLERLIRMSLETAGDVASAWAELVGDFESLAEAFARHAPQAFTRDELRAAHAWCDPRAADALAHADSEPDERPSLATRADDLPADRGVDGQGVEEASTLDREDDTLLLRLIQRLKGSLRRGVSLKEPLAYEHIFIDEAQDLSPVELAVTLDTLSRSRSVTLAGDISQRLLMDNGFSDWETVLGELGLDRVEVEPLQISYRSTVEIVEFSHAVLGPLRPEDPGQATRHGAPVELFSFAHSGDSIAFLCEALRELVQNEPRASVAVIARFEEHADLYFEGLRRAEVANLRRVAHQDFSFKAGVDVTTVRQVKGLEFDYVVLVEVSDAVYPDDTEARHLLHIAATRAAHQLWVLTTGRPSELVPPNLAAGAV